MTNVSLQLTYPQLSTLLQNEINKQEISIKGYDITIAMLVINSENGSLRLTGEIISKWNAYFDFSAKPVFDSDSNTIHLEELTLDLDAKHLLFKGILKLIKGNIKSRIAKMTEQSLDDQLDEVKQNLDLELNKAPLPHELQLESHTEHLKIRSINALPKYLEITAEISQKIAISFKDTSATPPD